ncbi:MAG TPA: hypothetical protein VGM10_16955 [Actinocrinis sp.]|jgi:hypothetical protein
MADSFLIQLVLDAASAGFTALLGGLAVGSVVQSTQRRRESRDLIRSLGFEMMEQAYGFYYITEEGIRRRFYDGDAADLTDLQLHSRYERFRLAARVIEQKLAIYLPETDARWLWHCVIDLLSVRYYSLVHRDTRLDDLLRRLALHPTHDEPSIPATAKGYFLGLDGLRDEKVVRESFERTLERGIRLTLDTVPDSRFILPRIAPRPHRETAES